MVLKIFGKYWYIVNKWRHSFASTLKVKVENITIHFTQKFNFWRSVISLIPGNRFHWISKYKWEKSNEIFFEKYILVKTFSSDNYLQKRAFGGVSCESYSENFINFPGKHSQCHLTCNFVWKSNFTGMFFLEIYEVFWTAIIRNYTFFWVSS